MALCCWEVLCSCRPALAQNTLLSAGANAQYKGFMAMVSSFDISLGIKLTNLFKSLITGGAALYTLMVRCMSRLLLYRHCTC